MPEEKDDRTDRLVWVGGAAFAMLLSFMIAADVLLKLDLGYKAVFIALATAVVAAVLWEQFRKPNRKQKEGMYGMSHSPDQMDDPGNEAD